MSDDLRTTAERQADALDRIADSLDNIRAFYVGPASPIAPPPVPGIRLEPLLRLTDRVAVLEGSAGATNRRLAAVEAAVAQLQREHVLLDERQVRVANRLAELERSR